MGHGKQFINFTTFLAQMAFRLSDNLCRACVCMCLSHNANDLHSTEEKLKRARYGSPELIVKLARAQCLLSVPNKSSRGPQQNRKLIYKFSNCLSRFTPTHFHFHSVNRPFSGRTPKSIDLIWTIRNPNDFTSQKSVDNKICIAISWHRIAPDFDFDSVWATVAEIRTLNIKWMRERKRETYWKTQRNDMNK